MANLDLKDKKILYELDLNSRHTFKEIANKIRLSKDATFYRIKRLENEGIIERYQTLINVGKLGYISFRIFYKLQNTTSKIEEEIVKFLKDQRIVVWMATIEGYWDINTWILCKEVSELEDFWGKFTSRYLNYLADKQLSIFTDITYYSRAYMLEGKQNEVEFKFVTTPRKAECDDTDVKILQRLNLNARMPILDIAKQIGLSAKQVSHRIKNMERKKIIIGYRTMFNLEKLGYLHYHLNMKVKDLTKEKEREFISFFFSHPNILYSHRCICGPDLEIDIEVESVEKLRDIINEIKDRFSPNIQGYDILHYLKQHKYIYMPER